MMRNNLFLNRLIIITNDGQVAYDERYHKGVNIIRGENSSGKSTITHFIFYILGGSFKNWVKEARSCSCVYAETEMNGTIITLKRNINIIDDRPNDKEAIYFYFDKIEIAMSNTEGWMRFGYNSTETSKSFSNLIFESLDLPITKADNNITIHQVLRLIYSDQESPTNSLFFYEQFDTSITRETVSDLLLGIYDDELYQIKTELIDLDKKLTALKSEIQVIKKFNINFDNPSAFKQIINSKEKEIEEIESQIIDFNKNNKKNNYTKATKLEFEDLENKAIKQRIKIKSLISDISKTSNEIEDTEYFITKIFKKLDAIRKSIKTRQYLGNLPIEFCPECLSKITDNEESSKCKLCKKDIEDNFGISEAKKIEQELTFQIKESRMLVDKKKRELINYKSMYKAEQFSLYHIQKQVNSSLQNVTTVREEKLNKLYTDKGFIEGEILQFKTLLENSEIYQKLVEEKNSIKKTIDELTQLKKQKESQQYKLKQKVNKIIQNKGVFLLNNDFKRETDFFEAKEFHIDYSSNIAFILDKEAKYSASSSFYLKTSARFAIFLASLETDSMRFPRFILCDNMEDKGIEEKRAQNFQEILITETEKYNSDAYQVIYTTSFIPEKFNNSNYCVGDYYSEDNKSLKNI